MNHYAEDGTTVLDALPLNKFETEDSDGDGIGANETLMMKILRCPSAIKNQRTMVQILYLMENLSQALPLGGLHNRKK